MKLDPRLVKPLLIASYLPGVAYWLVAIERMDQRMLGLVAWTFINAVTLAFFRSSPASVPAPGTGWRMQVNFHGQAAGAHLATLIYAGAVALFGADGGVAGFTSYLGTTSFFVTWYVGLLALMSLLVVLFDRRALVRP